MRYLLRRFFLAAILAVSGAGVSALELTEELLSSAGAAGINPWPVSLANATTTTIKTKKSKDIAAGQVIQINGSKFVKIGDNRFMAEESASCFDPVLTSRGAVKNFDYTGDEQMYTAYAGCQYKVEVWGAQGGNSSNSSDTTYDVIGGYGSYAVGTFRADVQKQLYIYVGGMGVTTLYRCQTVVNGSGYNGGGNYACQASSHWCSGGGGATHIASVNGLLNTLSDHKTDGSIYLVAGGGGGACGTTDHSGVGGHAGGYTGNQGTRSKRCAQSDGLAKCDSYGGTQTAGGASAVNGGNQATAGFGAGCKPHSTYVSWCNAGGGGGYYGGGCGAHTGGAGGSGYIGSSNLISDTNYGVTKHMTCYDCTISTTDATRTESNTCVNATATADCSKTGNGFARITRLN